MVDIYAGHKLKIRVSNAKCIELYKFWYRKYKGVKRIPKYEWVRSEIYEEIKHGQSIYDIVFEDIIDEWIHQQKMSKISEIVDKLI